MGGMLWAPTLACFEEADAGAGGLFFAQKGAALVVTRGRGPIGRHEDEALLGVTHAHVV